MAKLVNKLILLLSCLFVYVMSADAFYIVAPVIVAVIVSALLSIFSAPAPRLAGLALFTGLGVFFPDFVYFAPLILYDFFAEPYALSGLALLVPAALHFGAVPWRAFMLLLLLVCVGCLVKYYSIRLERLRAGYFRQSDEAKELALRLERKNKDLLDKQDYEVNLATLNERNRIAREIHDSVGHIMSSAILQVGALKSTARDPDLTENLNDLQNTLAQGMDSIRSSIHALYEDSVDLNAQLYALVRDFGFCSLAYDYDVENAPGLKTRYAFIAIAKEALANIIRHSDATSAALTVRELPGFYQMIVSDNGSPKTAGEGGMGLRNIASRVESLGGHFHIDSARGFRLFISVPKEAAP